MQLKKKRERKRGIKIKAQIKIKKCPQFPLDQILIIVDSFFLTSRIFVLSVCQSCTEVLYKIFTSPSMYRDVLKALKFAFVMIQMFLGPWRREWGISVLTQGFHQFCIIYLLIVPSKIFHQFLECFVEFILQFFMRQ